MKMKFSMGRLLVGSILGFLLMSVSLLLMPFQRLGFLPGILFWTSLLAGVVGQILMVRILRKRAIQSTGFGLATFFANPWAKLADIGLLVSLLAATLALTLCPAAYICYAGLAAAAFCFCLHCILNGRIFGYVMEYDRSRRKPNHNNQ